MREPVKILYVVQELIPYLPETLLANICRELPQYIQEQGCEIRIFMPCYGVINERRNQLHEVQRLSGMNLIIDDNDHPLIIKVATLPSARMQVYFIDNEDYFRRRGTVVDAEGAEYEDNDDRMIFFARGVLETIKKLRWTPDLIHCHGWFTGLIPLYVRTAYHDDPFFQNSKIVYTAYNNGFSRVFDGDFVKRIAMKGLAVEQIPQLQKSSVNVDDIDRVAMANSDLVVAGEAEINDSLAQKAAECNTHFEAFAEEYKQNYQRIYADIEPAL